MDTKSIKEAIWDIKNALDPVLIQFVKSDGSISRKRCIYKGSGNVASTSQAALSHQDDDTPIKAGMPGKFTLAGTLPLYDVDAQKLVTPKIAHIIKVNRFLIKH